MAIKFSVKIVRLKVYCFSLSPVTLAFIQGHNCVSNLTHLMFNMYCIIIVTTRDTIYDIDIWHDSILMHAMYIYAHAWFDDLSLDARPSQWVDRGINSAFNYLDN